MTYLNGCSENVMQGHIHLYAGQAHAVVLGERQVLTTHFLNMIFNGAGLTPVINFCKFNQNNAKMSGISPTDREGLIRG